MPIVALPLAVVGIAMLIVWFAGQQLHIIPFQGIAHFGGTVGGWMLNWAKAGIEWAIKQAIEIVRSSVNAVLGLITLPIHWLQSHFDDITNGLFNAVIAINTLRSVILPRAISQALATAHAWVAGAENYAVGLARDVTHWAQAQFASVYDYINHEVAVAENYTGHLVSQAEAFTAAEVTAAEHYATGLYQTAIGYTDTEIRTVTGWVTGEIGQVTTWAGNRIDTLQAWTVGALAGAGTYALSVATAVEADLDALKRDCTDNLCSNLGPLANVIKSLEGDLGLLGVIALAGEFARDPKGTATAVADAFKPVADAATSAVRAAAGF